ncbi:hypothetical protein M0R45_019678 [Rubus argutus]|uniref:Uncharacterized protein n=1 Tax=Rubus argutus TaxID=59490 RepID=A0AAW1X7N4_RUBAR
MTSVAGSSPAAGMTKGTGRAEELGRTERRRTATWLGSPWIDDATRRERCWRRRVSDIGCGDGDGVAAWGTDHGFDGKKPAAAGH